MKDGKYLMARRVTKEEVDFIKNNLLYMTYKEIGEKLERSEAAIAHTVIRLNMNRKGHAKKLTGKRYGKLLVLEYILTDKNGNAIWLCICDCENKKRFKARTLMAGKANSCGCKRRENQFKTIENMAYKGHKEAAMDRNIDSLLTKEEYLEIARKPCVYCGEISSRKNQCTGALLSLNSVDRINNDKFYTIDSVQSVCFTCQEIKGPYKHEEFVAHLDKIALYGKKKL